MQDFDWAHLSQISSLKITFFDHDTSLSQYEDKFLEFISQIPPWLVLFLTLTSVRDLGEGKNAAHNCKRGHIQVMGISIKSEEK